MRYIDLSLIDENDPELKEWNEKAKRNYEKACSITNHKERNDYIKNNNIWSEFKPILFKLYGEKCWYSECDLTGSFGDLDHFRPKNSSKDINNNSILEEGYWWLAYDYHNYRLSCEKCNRPYGEGGKGDYFPLKPGTNPASFPNDDDIPLILDPCVLSDTQLIDCDESGAIICLSEDEYAIKRVDVSKKIYNWNEFNTARLKMRNQCKMAIEHFESLYYRKNLETADVSQLVDLIDERTPFSSFARKYLLIKIEGKPYEKILKKLINREP